MYSEKQNSKTNNYPVISEDLRRNIKKQFVRENETHYKVYRQHCTVIVLRTLEIEFHKRQLILIDTLTENFWVKKPRVSNTGSCFYYMPSKLWFRELMSDLQIEIETKMP